MVAAAYPWALDASVITYRPWSPTSATDVRLLRVVLASVRFMRCAACDAAFAVMPAAVPGADKVLPNHGRRQTTRDKPAAKAASGQGQVTCPRCGVALELGEEGDRGAVA